MVAASAILVGATVGAQELTPLGSLRGVSEVLVKSAHSDVSEGGLGHQVAAYLREGGLLVQTRDYGADKPDEWKVVTKRKPTEAEFHALHFAWFVCKHVKSNAIVLARDTQVVGVGAGQMSRVVSVEIAVKKAGEKARGSVLASDAFFPFPDNVHAAAAAGVTAIIQPGGSVKDKDSIAACDEHGIAMLFTGVRHFRH